MQLTQTWGVTLISRGVILGLPASSYGAPTQWQAQVQSWPRWICPGPCSPDAYPDPNLYYSFLIPDLVKDCLGFRA